MTDLLPARPRRTTDRPVERWVDGALVNADRAEPPVALNPTALALWELCDGQTEVAEMVDAVCVLFALDAVRARHDVEAALTEMAAAGVIR